MINKSRRFLSIFLAAEIAATALMGTGVAMADGGVTPLAGTPYNTSSEYSVNVPHVIINQVYGAGLSADASVLFSNGFIELYNPTDQDIDLSSWSLQYADRGTTATTGATNDWEVLNLSGTIKAHSSFLIKGKATTASAPLIDLSGKGDLTWDRFINNKGLKVALMSNQTKLTVANPFLTKPAGYVDMVGTGSNDDGSTIDGYEGAADLVDYPTGDKGGTSKKKAIRRTDFADSDINKNDFSQIDYDALKKAGIAGDIAAVAPRSTSDGPWGVTTPEQPETPETNPVTITTTTIAGATIGTAYTATVAAAGGTAPFTYSATNLPTGLTLNSATGVITGTPTADAKSSLVTVTATDSANPVATGTKSFWLTVGQQLRDMKDTLSVEKIGTLSIGTSNKDGGVAEIVKYNKDNNKFYLVNGSGNPPTLEIVSLGNAKGTLTTEKTVLVKDLSETKGFVYGDLTSVDINTTTKRVSVSVQEKDPLKPGKILVLDYDGNYVTEYGAGVQPDMIKSTEDGRYILTADEAEPRLVTQDAKGSITIVDTVTGKSTPAYFDDPSVIEDGVHIRGALDPVTNTVKSSGSKQDALYDLEPEYITLSADGKTAYVTLQENNAVAVVDIATQKVTAVKALGLKDYNNPANALDVQSNGSIQLETVPFKGMYMPDGAASYTVNGKTYILTANEGDASEFRVNASTAGALKGSLDPNSEAYKFLKDTTAYDAIEVAGDMGNDGIYMYGGRSFSIWNADSMDQVYDSGNDFENITAVRLPDYFNVSNSKITMDDRSVKKGPEPEDIKVGKVGDRQLAFIGLERVGGLMTYDVTDPEHPQFANYTNTRVFKGADDKVNLDTDTGPEGIEFIPASVSPTGQPLVLVAYEVGGKVGIYQLNVTKVSIAQKSLSLTAGGTASQLTATVVPANGSSSSVTWSSSDANIATVDQNGKVTPVKAGTAVIKATSADGYGVAESTVTVAASPVVTPEQPSSGGTGGGGTTIIDNGSSGANVVTKVDSTTNGSGKASANVTSSQFTSALKKLRNELSAGQAGSLTVSAIPDSKAKEAAIVLEKGIFTDAKDAALTELTIEAGVGTVSFDAKAIASIAAASKNNDVTITVRQSDAATAGAGLTGAKRTEFLQAVGSHPVFDFAVKANGSAITTFGGGTAHVQVPYTPAASEDRNAIIIYYVSDSGELVTVPSGVYDPATGTVSFEVTHFSRYAVAYNKKSFKDTTSNFAKDAITYLSARRIISGTSSSQFSPKARITRADFTILLSRIAGDQLSSYKAGKFSDVRTTDYYATAVQWAADKGITSGVGGGKFNPKASITRAEMAAMLVRFAGVMNFDLPAIQKAVTFADGSAIQASVKEAVKAVQQAGIINGKTKAGHSGVYFAPQDFATREETAKMLAVFMQLMSK
ncbi:choice-of-anchor I family protein [Paenibacillus sp. JDR-2]|uniref:choice-of-anchor I family protein n=1 Tax=Paenibacillus sp. (strain JDR-2) TaxID=324057 RepID=UPI0001664C15|nr:choice-of-anchor I family protein [Paenibacillus sp. JDR-2]ACS99660.1 Ig domain protein group 2 domain protein [Paenibacillus sp. JDR-2]